MLGMIEVKYNPIVEKASEARKSKGMTAGIHAHELGARDSPDPAAIGRMLAEAGVMPKAVMHQLAW